MAEAAATHATAAAAQAHASSLRAAQEMQHLTEGLLQAATRRNTQLQITTAAESLTHRAVADIGVAQEEIANPPPPQAPIVVEVAWHSTLNPLVGTADSVPSVLPMEHAIATGEHTVDTASPTSPAVPTPTTPPGGILALLPSLPSLPFPWPAPACMPSHVRAAQIRARRQ